MRKLLCVIIVFTMLAGLCACTHPADVSEDIPEISDEDLYAVEMEDEAWPVIDGSAAFLPYYTAAASRLLGISEEEASRYVLFSSTDYAYSDLIYGRADVIFAFLPDRNQAMLADHEGISLACYPVLNEAFVFFTNAKNPVDELTLEQVRDIYTGRITNWSEVGGEDETILPFRRSEGSSDHEGLLLFVAKEDELAPAPMEERPGTMGETADVPANYDSSSGALGCGYLHAVRTQYDVSELKFLKIDGIEPSEENIQNRIYPLISQACAVIRGGEEETPAGQLAQWCAWPLGQALAKEKGYEPNMPVDAQEASSEPAEDGESEQYDWAEGGPVPRASGKTLQRNGLNIESPLVYNTDSLYASCPIISGLKDKSVEAEINERLRSQFDAFCDPEYLPEVQGIETYKTEGLQPKDLQYRMVAASTMGSKENMLSIVMTYTAMGEVPRRGKSGPRDVFFAVCRPFNFDLKTGKEIPITALVSDDVEALPYLDGLTAQYVRENADTAYRDEDDFGTTESLATVSVRVTSLPGLKKDQSYYLDDLTQTVYLVLDVQTPWAVTGPGYSCIPLDLADHAAFDRFHTEESLFE